MRKSRNAKRASRTKWAWLSRYYNKLHAAEVGTIPRINPGTLVPYFLNRRQPRPT